MDYGYGGCMEPVPMNAWLDGETHILCYREGTILYSRYVDTNTITTASLAARHLSRTEVMSWDRKIRLPEIPESLPECMWDIHAGYHPNLLSPLTFASQQDDGDDDEDDEASPFIRSLLRAFRHQKQSKRRLSIMSTDHTNGKRVCSGNP
ncbi:hypothetical protein E2562_030966 [Oryza meyeriana var. granulata]|uniref:Uncharacterized protein n=1 Tax=Oryza meyeriana var. granulata TaxID=110450 RepID=A0A6G1ERC1_9ORYZ|nr:hypothetical protein E2562_030966 [Oryza meyeriana var. granulata]